MSEQLPTESEVETGLGLTLLALTIYRRSRPSSSGLDPEAVHSVWEYWARDEAPMAYKDVATIKQALDETAHIGTHLEPVLNVKTLE